MIVKIMLRWKVNNRYILFTSKKAKKNKVNLNYCFDFKNVGDNIAPVLVDYVAAKKNIDVHKRISSTKHLYTVGSIITAGPQDCTIWGSGLLNTKILNRFSTRKLDVRAVRGPLTRIILMDHGYAVPEVYGDPAILMPFIYNPTIEKKYKVSIVTHLNESARTDKRIHRINVVTDDYKTFVEEIKASELVISSSLHGIVFAESYGVKAVLLKPKMDLFKYFDYYYSTGRYTFPIAETVEEALSMKALELPDFTKMRENLLEAFPYDIWK